MVCSRTSPSPFGERADLRDVASRQTPEPVTAGEGRPSASARVRERVSRASVGGTGRREGLPEASPLSPGPADGGRLFGDPNPRCPDCGHRTYFHRANGEDQTTMPGDPVPCYAVVARVVLRPETAERAGEYGYHYCGCTTVHPEPVP